MSDQNADTPKPGADNILTLQLARAVWQSGETGGSFKNDEERRSSWEASKKGAMVQARKIQRQLEKHNIALLYTDPGA